MSEINIASITEKVNTALLQLRPFLHADGGDMELVEITDDGIVKVHLLGSCSDCSMSKMTMLDGVQTTLVEQVPGVVKVRDITDHARGANPYYS